MADGRGRQPSYRRDHPRRPDDRRRRVRRRDRPGRPGPRRLGASSTVEDRAATIRRVGELHGERREELAEIIVREMELRAKRGEVDFAAAIYGYYAENGPALMADESIELLAGAGSAVVRRSSYGLLLGIMPWNYPYYQVARFAGPNLVIGNAILLKHVLQCPEARAGDGADSS